MAASVFVYAVSYDLGFAPNPFGGLCSLACCKPKIREMAAHGDWVVGLTGVKTKPALRCVFAMIVTRDVTFDEYWSQNEFRSRRAVRNGSAKKVVGDNIYHRATPIDPWQQEDSVHCEIDGLQSISNTAHDTRVNRVLLSDRFIYFGSQAPAVPEAVLDAMNYTKNARDYRRFGSDAAKPITEWLAPQIQLHTNQVLAGPINFASREMRYSPARQRMV